jgi:hypothetical protein
MGEAILIIILCFNKKTSKVLSLEVSNILKARTIMAVL